MTALTADIQSPGISVVIATLGGPTLKGTVETLNCGSIVPTEILVCLPATEAARGLDFSFPNVRVVQTGCRGQVSQRIEGFRQATNEFVMQLDDDITVDRQCLEYLLASVREFPDTAVAPALVNSRTGDSVYRVTSRGSLFTGVFNWIMNGRDGYRDGSILRAGFPVGIIPNGMARNPSQVEWLAGGCVMHRRANLILENYFPFSGKAHCEDMIHSHLLTQKGVRLLVDSRASCSLEVFSPFDRTPGVFMRDSYNDYRARSYFMRLSGRPAWRMYLYYVLIVFRYMYLLSVKLISRGRTLPVPVCGDAKRHVD